MHPNKAHLLLFIWLTVSVSVRGQPLPFSGVEQAEMFVTQNQFRRNIENQINMQCLVKVDQKLVADAQNMANTCKPSQPTNTTNGFAWFFDQTYSGTIEQFMEQVEAEYGSFDYAKGQCGEPYPSCDLFRQVAWFEAENIGCGRANCTEGTLTVCAYTFKQNPSSFPYISLPNGQPCTACPSGMSCVNNLCCNPDTGSTTPTPTAPPINCSTPTSFTPITRLFSGGLNKNYLLTDPDDIATVSTFPNTKNLGVIGQLAQSASKCQYAVPVYRLYNRVINSESTVADPLTLQYRLKSGWRKLNLMGYAVQGNGVCGASVAIYEFYNPTVGMLQIQQGPDANDLINQVKFGVYHYRGISYYVWPA